jgi:radial spoke head protein 9
MAFYQLEHNAVFHIAGFTLNIEESTALKASLIVKKQEEKLDQIALWGKLLGVHQDYFIAQSYSDEDYFKRKYFYTY